MPASNDGVYQSTNDLSATVDASLSVAARAADYAHIQQTQTALEEIRNIASVTEQCSALAALARQDGGFLTDELRCVAWSIAMDLSEFSAATASGESGRGGEGADLSWKSLPRHKDESQVRLDVDRAFVYYPVGLSSARSAVLKDDLYQTIVATLRQLPKLCYFQGYHDIVQVLLLVLGKEEALPAAASLSMLRLRDFMLPTLTSSLAHLELLPAIITAADPVLAAHIAGTRPFFALGATLTLFAHEVESYDQIARLFDFLLTHEASVALYLYAAIVLSRREELLSISLDEPEMLHFTLSKMPKPLAMEDLIASSWSLICKFPPTELPSGAWSRISIYSVLKTTRDDDPATPSEAEALLDAQIAQSIAFERRQRLFALAWSWRRPIGSVGAAVAIGLLSIWLQNRGNNSSPLISSSLATFHSAMGRLRNLLPL